MKKIISAVLVLISILTLTACTKYKPQKSTKEESETALTLSIGETKYDVPYEVYRTFFLNYRDVIDGGDHSVWQGAEKDKYIKEIESVIGKSSSASFIIPGTTPEVERDICLYPILSPHS